MTPRPSSVAPTSLCPPRMVRGPRRSRCARASPPPPQLPRRQLAPGLSLGLLLALQELRPGLSLLSPVACLWGGSRHTPATRRPSRPSHWRCGVPGRGTGPAHQRGLLLPRSRWPGAGDLRGGVPHGHLQEGDPASSHLSVHGDTGCRPRPTPTTGRVTRNLSVGPEILGPKALPPCGGQPRAPLLYTGWGHSQANAVLCVSAFSPVSQLRS